MYEISINEDIINVEFNKGQPIVDQQQLEWDIVRINANLFHLLVNGKSYSAEVVGWNEQNKELVLKLNNRTATLHIKTEQDLLLEKLGLNKQERQNVSDIKAPMPGLILEVPVAEGQQVEKGMVLLVLEAMKMENAIKSPQSGEVKKVLVKPGQGVEKNQLLIQF